MIFNQTVSISSTASNYLQTFFLFAQKVPPLGHSPSRMHTLMRRTAPPLALARNCLSSGVTVRARNMAGQRRPSPAGGVGTQKKQCSGQKRSSRILSPVQKYTRIKSRSPSLQVRLRDGSAGGLLRFWTHSVCMKWDVAQVNETESRAEMEPDLLSPKFSSLTVQAGKVAREEPNTSWKNRPTHTTCMFLHCSPAYSSILLSSRNYALLNKNTFRRLVLYMN